jgi:transposase InsO family protein
MNRLQAALLEHDFVVQYKKGTTMPADYLSRLPSFPQEANTSNIIAAFDPFQPNLPQLQHEDSDLQAIFKFLKTGQWHETLTKRQIRTLSALAPKVFLDKNKLAWIRLEDYKYPRTALWLPQFYRKEALCEAHDQMFAGHNAAQKSYIKLTSSYFWPNAYVHVLKHTQTCLRCQQRKQSRSKKAPLVPLPIPDQPNIRIHADLFGPMLGSDKKSAYILCITDAFTKYAVVTKIDNKDAETVAKAIFNNWFCKFGIPAQVHTDGGKEFVNKLSAEMFELLNVQHSKTSPYHPQCNSQVEVFNKTVKKYLASYVDDSTLNWDEWLPALMLAYNTSYHSTIATTPFELLFGVKPRLPSLPAPDIERHHYGESIAAERFQMLQQARKLAQLTAAQQGEKYKNQYDKLASPHKFEIGQKVWLSDTTSIGKNAKLTPNWIGPYQIIDINDTNAKLQIKNKQKVVNIARLKMFVEEATNRSSQGDQRLLQGDPGLFLDQQDQPLSRPMTRAFKKLTDLKNAATMAISLLSNIEAEECYGNIFEANFDKYHCKNCYNGIKTFLSLPNHKQIFQKTCDKSICSTTFQNSATQENLINKNADPLQNSAAQENLIKNDADQSENDADQSEIMAIKTELRGALLSVASKLLKDTDTRLHHLSKAEQDLWNSFEKADIYEFLTGEKDTIPEFQFNWFSPEAPVVHLVPSQPIPPAPVAPPVAAQPPAPIVAPPPVQAAPYPAQQPTPEPPGSANVQPVQQDQQQLLPPQPPQPQPGVSDRQLRAHKPVDYKELNSGIKTKCKTLRRKAKAVVTKLAPGAFSPQPAAPSQAET